MKEIGGFGMKIVVAAIVLSILFFILALLTIYFSDEFKIHPENEQSVQAPKT
jgi:hypothetical protein